MEDDSQRNLIVNYLPSSLTPASFKEMFASYGEIESSRIILDKATGTSQGYGFIKFATNEAAAKAIQVMNGRSVENKTLKVSLARAANPAGAQQANIYVANLPKHYTKAELEQTFLPYGSLIETKILLDPATGVSKGVGFVRFASKDQAQVAIDALNNQTPLGADTPIVVRFSDTREEKVRKGKVPGGAYATRGQFRFDPMMRAGLPPSMGGVPTPGAYGVAAQFPMYQAAGAPPTPFGVYGQASVAPTPALAYCLFIYNLPQDADEGLLYRLFGPFGAISDVKVMRDSATTQCKGYGFVHYLKLEDAQQAIISMNGYQVGNKFLQVSFKKQK